MLFSTPTGMKISSFVEEKFIEIKWPGGKYNYWTIVTAIEEETISLLDEIGGGEVVGCGNTSLERGICLKNPQNVYKSYWRRRSLILTYMMRNVRRKPMMRRAMINTRKGVMRSGDMVVVSIVSR